MYLHFYNVIFMITHSITFLVYAQDQVDWKVNQNKSESIKNIFPNVFTSQTTFQSDKGAFSFLLKDKTLTDLNIHFTNKENAIEILKGAGRPTQGFNNVTLGSEDVNSKENYRIDKTILNLLINTTNANTVYADENVDKNIPAVNISSKDTSFSILNNILNPYKNNEKAIQMLNAATISMSNNMKNLTKENKTENELVDVEREIENFGNYTSSVDIKNNTRNKTSVNDHQVPVNEIILSELTNLSYNIGEELSLGQKIQFQRSNINSETESTILAGTEILKNTSRVCGSQFGKRISFANETTLMEFPWTVLLLYNTKVRYHCGGSLITKKYVLTAAHCVAQEFFELIGVRLGEHDISEPMNDCAPDLGGDNICATKIDVDVVKIIVHHAYSHLSFKNDIALLRLDKDYISRSYYPICIQTPEMMFNEARATVAGWGATEKAIRSAILLKANVPVLDMSKCREIYRYSVFNDSTEICGSGSNEVDVCKGDSGGALFFSKHFKGKDKYYQLGIVSLGVRRCGDKRFLPAVFTKIQGFYKWIESNLEY